MGDPWSWLVDARERSRSAGLVRHLDPGAPGLLDLASNDYLGLARHSDVVAGAVSAAQSYGAGSTGSRLVTGTTELHLALEQRLATFCGAEAALVFSSGYLANLGALAVLAGPGTLVVSDSGNHASLIDACRLSRATVAVVPHGDVGAVDAALAAHDGRAVVVTDAVFSVDGSLAPLVELHEVTRRHGALLLVDEAHGLGVVGPSGQGACALLGIDTEQDVVRTVTLSKSLGSQGGAVLGPAMLRDQLVDTARPFIFDTGLAPSCAGAALAALELVTTERVAALSEASRGLASAVGVPATPGAVVRVVLGDPHRATAARDACRERGVRVGCFRPPSVPVDGSCLRLAARANLTSDEIAFAAAVVAEAVA